jgi:redox-sensing transcriptional repressor
LASERTIGRLTLYRRILNDLAREGETSLHSHQLASHAGVSAAQVRRDLMATGYAGSPNRGYDVQKLLESLRNFLDKPGGQGMALVGIGNLGRALLSYFIGRRPHLSIVAAFDTDPAKTGRVIHGCRCYPIDQLETVVGDEGIEAAVIAVPVEQAQPVAERLVRCGVRGLLNFAPVALHLPPDVYVENIDVTMSLEKVAYFSRGEVLQGQGKERQA